MIKGVAIVGKGLDVLQAGDAAIARAHRHVKDASGGIVGDELALELGRERRVQDRVTAGRDDGVEQLDDRRGVVGMNGSDE